jgi:PAS domain-containing protein
MAGQDFVALLRSDERDRIYFAREGRKGSPQTLVNVPLSDPELGGQKAGEAPSLMMLFDAGVGLGGWGSEARGQTPQLESLLEQLPLGLAMTDRDGHFLFANPAFRRAAGVDGRDAALSVRPRRAAGQDRDVRRRAPVRAGARVERRHRRAAARRARRAGLARPRRECAGWARRRCC